MNSIFLPNINAYLNVPLGILDINKNAYNYVQNEHFFPLFSALIAQKNANNATVIKIPNALNVCLAFFYLALFAIFIAPKDSIRMRKKIFAEINVLKIF